MRLVIDDDDDDNYCDSTNDFYGARGKLMLYCKGEIEFHPRFGFIRK